MNKYVLILVCAALFITGCKKSGTGPAFDPYHNDTVSYLPLTTGNTWTYLHTTATHTDTLITTKNTDLATVGNKVFDGVADNKGGEIYYDDELNKYYMLISPGSTFAQIVAPILDTNQPVGYTLTTNALSDSSYINTSIQTVLTIVDVNCTKKVNGKTYNCVIHTNLNIQCGNGFGYTSIGMCDFYFAKNIGLIEIDKSNSGFVYDSKTIISYKLK